MACLSNKTQRVSWQLTRVMLEMQLTVSHFAMNALKNQVGDDAKIIDKSDFFKMGKYDLTASSN
jgi:succinate dehydrogenase flavin-adding protein (antitoxin of CptAB toxin-antitoxin module)